MAEMAAASSSGLSPSWTMYRARRIHRSRDRRQTVFEGQLPAADEPGETARVRAAELHQAGVARVSGQLLAGNVEGPIPKHIDVLIGDQHDAVEVERQEADGQLDRRIERRYEPGDVVHHADQEGGQQVVEGETHRHALLVDTGPPGHPAGHVEKARGPTATGNLMRPRRTEDWA